MNATNNTNQRTVTAFFDSRTDADAAVARLVALGVSRDGIAVRGGQTGTSGGTSTGARDDDMGFWDSLKDLFMPDDDRATYAEGLRRGGFIVTVRADSAHYERVLDVLDDEGTVDLDQRAETWRSEGWSGISGTAAGTTPGAATAGYAASSTRTTGNVPAAGTATQARAGDQNDVIALTEEQIRVGKREVSHGRVKVRSYVVETPVHEQVGLREEHVTIERRPVDRAATGADNLFQERVIEAEERAEEAVISKEARVKEELVLRKDTEQRTQTVSDTVRRTEVEIEDERGNVQSTERKTS
jgi:uncharacterized protein (TIGR02271 family)